MRRIKRLWATHVVRYRTPRFPGNPYHDSYVGDAER